MWLPLFGGEVCMENKILIIVLFLFLFVGIGSATEPTDTINDIDDSITALEIATEGYKDLQKLQEDPTNISRLEDAVTRPFDILFGGDIHDAEGVKKSFYGIIILAVIGTFLTPIIALLKGK